MLFENEAEAMEWLNAAGVKVGIETSRGCTGFTRWTFDMSKQDYCSLPSPTVRPGWKNDSSDARQKSIEAEKLEDQERIDKHKPKTFLEAVNMFAEELQIESIKDCSK